MHSENGKVHNSQWNVVQKFREPFVKFLSINFLTKFKKFIT